MSSKPLTKDLLLSKCKTDKLTQIKNVNLWGNDLDDLGILNELPNVEIVSLSLNKICSLKDFSACNKLQELYLRKNQIQDLSEVQYLTKLQSLRVLWLSHNPCADQPYYRQYVIKMLPNLFKLDNAEITAEERQQARHMNFDNLFQQEHQQLQKKPSQLNVLQQNTSIQNHQSQAQSVQSKSPFKGEQQQQQIKKLVVEQKPLTTQSQQQQQQQQQQLGKKPTSVRPSSALNERSSSIVSSTSQQQVQQEQRNENILCAVLALLKELGESELELVKRDIEKKLQQKQQH